MANIYNYWKNVFQDLKLENNRHPGFVPLLLLLIAIPLIYAASNIALGLLLATALYHSRKSEIRVTPVLMLPVLLYLLMAVSILWTIDFKVTASALFKEIPLLLIPVCFMLLPVFSPGQSRKIIRYFSYTIFAYACFWMLRGIIRFMILGDSSVLFYHELVTFDLNAIHMSIFFACAYFYFITVRAKKAIDFFAAALLFVMLFMLSSKNIIITFVLLNLAYALFFVKISMQIRLAMVTAIIIALAGVLSLVKITDRFRIEYETAMNDRTVNNELSRGNEKVYNVSLSEAWSKKMFAPNDFFPGTAFRVYQFRIFCEMLAEDGIFFTGYGLNASYEKINAKTVQYNLYRGGSGEFGYQKNNFHNQYIQNFAELGFFGFILLLLLLGVNLKNALKHKDFVHISFAVLMISLFLTESFLWRQRGVMFFTAMYCLFNSRLALPAVGEDNKPI